ncbi:hypothetical protein [Micromonospora sp. NPDC050200]|uniref:hypothetical protein n=1 Tax=Micromonospora sp. NPDC050200 TaxID=3155664 RepID=UPI00340FB77C
MASLVALLLLLAVPPLVLVTVVGWPMHGRPDLQQVRAWVTQPLTEQTMTAAFTVLAWLIWLLVAYTATVSAARRVRSGARWLRRMPLPTPLQATATGMAGAAVFGASTHTAATGPAEPAVAVAAATLDTDLTDNDTTSPATTVVGVDAVEGVTVAGGWLPRDAAEQVAAASALVWLRRRRGYQPRQPVTVHRDDPDLAPLPATATAVHAALVTHPPAPAPPASRRQDHDHTLLPAGLAGGAPAGVAFTGPGALHAARGLLVTALLACLRQSRPTVAVLITDNALTTLLGTTAATAVRAAAIPGLVVTGSADDAVVLIETATPDRGAAPHRHQRDPLHPGDRPPLVLITEVPSSPIRLAAQLGTGRVSAVVLGAWPLGATWHVDADGRSHDVRRPREAGPRLCVLNPAATTDLLTVITHTPPASAAPPAHKQAPPHAVIPYPRTPDPVAAASAPAPVHAADARRPVHLQVLGTCLLRVDGVPVPIRRTAALQALVLLAVHRHGASARQLTEALWPGLPAHSVAGRLYTTLSDLRTAIRRVCDLAIIDHTGDRYRLHPEHVDTDLWRLHAAAHHAATTLTDASAGWQAVIDSYTGDLAAGHTWPWVDQPREATRRLAIDAYAAAASAQPEPRAALALLQGGIRVDPYNEELHHRAVDTLTALGDHTAAADLRHTYTRRLTLAGLPPTPHLATTVVSGTPSTGG